MIIIKDRRTLTRFLFFTAVIVGCLYVVYRIATVSMAMDRLPNDSLGNFQGPAKSQKVIVEFIDYRCSHCREMESTMQQVMTENPDVKIIYRHLPVFGRPSVVEIEFALAAGMQGKFVQAHNILINREDALKDDQIDNLAASIGIRDMEKFHKDLKGPETGNMMLDTMDIAQALGINSTPSFVIGDIIYTMADGDKMPPTPETFKNLLQQAYGK